MGLLDQVLGQVIGNMAGGGQAKGGQAPGGAIGDILGQVLRGGLGGGAVPAPTPRQAPGGGGLGDLLGGAGGKLSPLLLAVLAVLAAKHIPTGAGGLGSILHDMLGGGGSARDRTADPRDAGGPPEDDVGEEGYGEPPAGMNAPPYPESRGGGRGRGDGGFLDDVGSMLDGPGGLAAPSQGADPLGGDFDELRNRFEKNGQGGLMDSWIGAGPNREAAPGDLEQALGPETIDRLSRQFGIDRGQLLDELSRALPQVVDGLTPQGRAPTQDERARWV